MTYINFIYFFMHPRFDDKMRGMLSYIKIFPTFLSFREIFVMHLQRIIKIYYKKDEEYYSHVLQSQPSLSCSFAVATFLPFLPAAAVVSGTRMFRATGLPHPPPIPLRLLHSFPPAADLSISSHSLFLIIFLPPLPRPLSLSCVLHLGLSSSRFINLPGPPDQLFFLPVTVQISIPETPRGRWGCGPFVSAPVSLIREITRNSAQYADIGP